MHLKILVPSIAAGAIIGKGGETIAQVQKEAGARVKMSKANDFYPGQSISSLLIYAYCIILNKHANPNQSAPLHCKHIIIRCHFMQKRNEEGTGLLELSTSFICIKWIRIQIMIICLFWKSQLSEINHYD